MERIPAVIQSIFGTIPAKYRGIFANILALLIAPRRLDNLINRISGSEDKRLDTLSLAFESLQQSNQQTNQQLGITKSELATVKAQLFEAQLEIKTLKESCANEGTTTTALGEPSLGEPVEPNKGSPSGNKNEPTDPINMGNSTAILSSNK
jgi:hypothetical protein